MAVALVFVASAASFSHFDFIFCCVTNSFVYRIILSLLLVMVIAILCITLCLRR